MYSLKNLVKSLRGSNKKKLDINPVSLDDELDSKPSGLALAIEKTKEIGEQVAEFCAGKERIILSAITVTVGVVGIYMYSMKNPKSNRRKQTAASEANWVGYRHITRNWLSIPVYLSRKW